MFYDKKIKYFDYMENGQRQRNAGFAKLEARDKVCNITLQVSGLHVIDNDARKVYLLSGDRKELLCEIMLKQGRGSARLQLPCGDLCGGISYEEAEAMQILVSPGREVLCRIVESRKGKEAEKVREAEEEKAREAEEEKARRAEEKRKIKEMQEAEEVRRVEDVRKIEERKVEEIRKIEEEQRTEEIRKKGEEQRAEEVRRIEEIQKAEEIQRAEEIKAIEEEQRAEEIRKIEELTIAQEQVPEQDTIPRTQTPLLDDKWKQLSAIYPHISPFDDERDYLSIGPGDFVILTQRYYKLVNNSFLLHGFYNYKHLILTRMENRGEVRFYIGVPGNFYEREKQVAVMFGFESFECHEEPAGSGDFGYYMIRVEI